jgi:polyhydroxyalkanoate synthesis repressor PhaR
MASERIITRYANRRLYDTAASRHVTLEDIRKLILDGEQIKVIDNRTGEDVTRTMLLQIVAEQEQHGKPILSTQLLHSILRFYGTAMEDLTAQYLEKSVEHLLRQQEMMRAQMAKMMNAAPMADLLEIARQNVNLWGDLQKRMFGLAPANGPAPSGKKKRAK